jgi:hypothetical protein
MRSARSKERNGPPGRTTESARPDRVGFLPEVLDRTVIAIPLLRELEDERKPARVFDIIIDLNLELNFGGRQGREGSSSWPRAVRGLTRSAGVPAAWPRTAASPRVRHLEGE